MAKLKYIVELDGDGYAALLQLVMRYGTGIGGEGIGTSVDFRRAISEVTYRTVSDDDSSSSPRGDGISP